MNNIKSSKISIFNSNLNRIFCFINQITNDNERFYFSREPLLLVVPDERDVKHNSKKVEKTS